MKKISIVFFVLAIFSTACGKKAPTTPDIPQTPPPTINSFTADPAVIAVGDFSTLEWSTTNATSCSIDQGVGSVSLSGIKFVDPVETTSYTLTVTNSSGTKTATVTIQVKGADLQIVGNIKKKMKSYGSPYFTGYVKNYGDNTAWNASITIYCYGDASQTTLIDTAWDYLADGNDIRPGERVSFEAICFDLTSHDQIKSTRIELDWLEGDVSTLSNLELQRLHEDQRRFQELKMKKARIRIKK
jgi:hypothetical protein